MNPFHYAFKVKNIESTRDFYINILGCQEGRSTEKWIDFNFFGHQLSAHVNNNIQELDYCGVVDGVSVPIPHFGAVVDLESFEKIKINFIEAEVKFIVEPTLRYEGKVGEQWTMFVLDYSNNPLEFKAFKNPEEVFAV